MKKIGEVEIKLVGRPKSERAYWVQQIASLLDKPFKETFGYTVRMTKDEIREIYDIANGWKVNPPALARKLIKERNQKIREQLSTGTT